jgi:hypothetical protein
VSGWIQPTAHLHDRRSIQFLLLAILCAQVTLSYQRNKLHRGDMALLNCEPSKLRSGVKSVPVDIRLFD